MGDQNAIKSLDALYSPLRWAIPLGVNALGVVGQARACLSAELMTLHV